MNARASLKDAVVSPFFWFCSAFAAHAGAAQFHPHKEPPRPLFTNIASQLLASQLNLELHRIQLYPTNQYSPAVHRLLQVAANLCDASTNNTSTEFPYLPSVFRPVFTKDHEAIYIADYAEVTSTNVLRSEMRDLSEPSDRAALQAEDMVWGVPLIVGARKGLPNFNEFSMETAVSVARKLQFLALFPRNPRNTAPFETNQMYQVAISNVFGIEAWNSYSNHYPRPLQIIVSGEITTLVTNELGKPLLRHRFLFTTNQTVAVWGGFTDFNHASNSFKIPFPPANSHFLALTNSSYSQALKSFVPLSPLFERNHANFAVPHWWLVLNTRLRVAIVDVGVYPHRLIDYVNLGDTGKPIDITLEMMSGAGCSPAYNPPRTGMVPEGLFWCTNSTSPFAITFGGRLQMDVSLGLYNADWKNSAPTFPGTGLTDILAAIDLFRTNLAGLPSRSGGGRGLYLTNSFYAPYNASRTLYVSTSWSANDPLVHYTPDDLKSVRTTNRVRPDRSFSQPFISNIGQVNTRYEPWGFSFGRPWSRTVFALELKDPLVRRSDEWDFPEALTISSLGHIHRGTPWQTIYLKSDPVSLETWALWSGVTDAGIVQRTTPTNDWRMVSSVIPLLVKERAHKLISINDATFSDWQSVFRHMEVLTNTAIAPYFVAPEFNHASFTVIG